MLQFLFFLRSQTVGLLLITAVGAFIWPTALAVGVALAAFPLTRAGEATETLGSSRAAAGLAAAAAAGFLLGFVHLVRKEHNLPGILVILPEDVSLSVALAAATILLGLIPLLDDRRLYSLHRLLGAIDVRGAALAVGTALVVKTIQGSLIGPKTTPYDLKHRLMITILTSAGKPGISLLAPLIFWGPVLWLIVFHWRTVCRAIHRMGVGLTIVVMMGFLLAICPEPRGALNIIPVVLLVGIAAIEPWVPGRALCWVLVPGSLFTSKFWYRINVPGEPFTGLFQFQRFPDQRFFMSYGPCIAFWPYLIQLAIAIALGVVLYVVCSRPACGHVPSNAPVSAGEACPR
jgi:hypothetical protein